MTSCLDLRTQSRCGAFHSDCLVPFLRWYVKYGRSWQSRRPPCTAWAWTLILLLLAGMPAAAFDKRYPDWPCRQLKVPELALAAVWPGFVPEEAPAADYPGMDTLVAKLAARRTQMEEAEKEIGQFVSGSPAEKQAKAKALFSALFNALGAQRFQVMNGLERAQRKQKELAEKIRADVDELRKLQDVQGDTARLQELVRQVQWETRIFDERRNVITYACEVPVQIDRRIFSLAHIIQAAGGLA